MSTPRLAVLAGLFVVGGLAGAGGTALLSAEDVTAGLVAGEQVIGGQPDDGGPGPNGGLEITIDVYNPNEHGVHVEPVAIGGWELAGPQAEALPAAGREWTAMSFEVIPDCENDAAATLDLVADDVSSELGLMDDAVDSLDVRRQWYCGSDGIVLDPLVEARSWDGETHVLEVQLPGHGRHGLGDVTIDAVSAGLPYAVEAEELPVTLPADGSITLTTRWTFDCHIGLAELNDPTGPGGERPYEAIYLTTANDVQIHADVSTWLSGAAYSACADAQ